MRVRLAAAYHLEAHFGRDDLICTHLSSRAPGREHHLLNNPYELMFEEITASTLVKIDTDENKVCDRRYTVDQTGFFINSVLQMALPDAEAVMHLHTPCGQAVTAMTEDLMPHAQTGMIVAHDLAYHD